MVRDSSFPRILVIAVWFGPLPDWIPLWLRSCRYNPDLDWMLLTDADTSDLVVPENVHIVRGSMADLATRVEKASGVKVRFEAPYKACDFRPLYWCLLDLVSGEWDFWGHCDIDMMFGDVRKFLGTTLLDTYDRIFGTGHFSVYRNIVRANNYYKMPSSDLDFREILADPRPRGFDEHLGVNLIWRENKGRFYEDERIVVDLDPNVGPLRRTSTRWLVRNNRRQTFGFREGRVFRAYARGGRIFEQDYMYVHFQKRQISISSLRGDETSVWITPTGFAPMTEDPLTIARIDQLNPTPLIPRWSELVHGVRLKARLFHRTIRRSSS